MLGEISFSIVIPAYNEESTISRCLDSITSQKIPEGFFLERIAVVSSSNDRTNEIVLSHVEGNNRIELVPEIERKGKVAAINSFLREEEVEICVMCDADVVLAEDSLSELLRPFKEREIGGVTGVPVVRKENMNFTERLGSLIWELHRYTTRREGKFSLLWAFRNEIEEIDVNAGADDSAVQQLIKNKGYKTLQSDKSIIYCTVPDNLTEYVIQRTRWRGCQDQMLKVYPEFKKDTALKSILLPILKFLILRPWKIPLFIFGSFLELYVIKRSRSELRGNQRAFSVWDKIESSR